MRRNALQHWLRAAAAAAAIWAVFLTAAGTAARPPADPSAQPSGSSGRLDFIQGQAPSSAALQKLAEEVRRYVSEDRVVGAEFLVMQDGRTLVHEAIGWKDRESRAAMVKNTIFNIRSMTKPLTGAAAQVLIDQGRLSETDKVSRFLPEFGQGRPASITVGHLLTHRSGLPLTILSDIRVFPSLSAVAQAAAAATLAFDPGQGFLNSDAGADVLAAVLEKASGRGFGDLLTEVLLKPLGMTDTFVLTRKGDLRAARVASAYVGSAGNWNRFWAPSDEPVYRFAMGSQSLYATPLDYARFLNMLLSGGRAGSAAVLSEAALKRIMTPASDTPFQSGFSERQPRYGQMMQVFTDSTDPEGRPAIIGHIGDSGTAAWAWPGPKLVVLLFTQSRNHKVQIPFESAVDRFLLNTEARAETPGTYRPYLGKYLDTFGPTGLEEISAVVLNGRLILDIPSQTLFPLEPTETEGRFILATNREVVVSFERNERGEVVNLKWIKGERIFDLPRLGTPAAEALRDRALQKKNSWKKYLGRYSTEQPGQTIEIIMQAGNLGILRQGQTVPILLNAPDRKGRWCFRVNRLTYVTFEENEKGDVLSFTVHLPDGTELVRPRMAPQAK